MANDDITIFRGDYYFLSNMYPCNVVYDGILYSSSEAAFQAQKCFRESDKYGFANMSASVSKMRGRLVMCVPNWDKIKDRIMYEVCLAKFTRNANLKAQLIQTGKRQITETNTWGDTYWGVSSYTGKGKNKLGKILMRIRDELINQNAEYE